MFTVTHPETAWIVTSVPLCLALAALLALALLLRGRLRAALYAALVRRTLARRDLAVDPQLLFVPPVAGAGQLLLVGGVAALLVLVALSRLTGLFIALLLSGPATVLLTWLLLWMLEQRYRLALDRALPAAVGRLGAQLRSGSGFQPALDLVAADLPAGPLKVEWQFIIRQLGAPIRGGLATPQLVVAALAAQTPSPRHAMLLGHLEIALGQTHDVLIARVQAAHTALLTAEQRRSQAATELAQIRYSGIAISLAGAAMATYLALTQWKRVVLAYQGPLGLIVGSVVITALIAPCVGGVLLARTEDLDY